MLQINVKKKGIVCVTESVCTKGFFAMALFYYDYQKSSISIPFLFKFALPERIL